MNWLPYAILAAACAYAALEIWRYFRRRQAMRITAEQLKARLDQGGEQPVLADLRSWQQIMQAGDKLPGARVTSAEDLLRDLRAGTIQGELVLYCS